MAKSKHRQIRKAATRGDNPDGRRPDIRAGRVRPTEQVGTISTAIYGGTIQSVEKDAKLVGTEKYRTFGEMLANICIVAASVRFFLNMVSKAKWKVEAPEGSGAQGQELAERTQEILDNMDTPLQRVVRKAAMFPFYGFAALEWTMRKAEDGTIEIASVDNRPQVTIERWDTEPSGKVLAILQRNPQTQVETAIPREKLIYLVDDSLSDSPEGLGLFRHVVEACQRLRRYEQLEGFGYENDLRGVPVIRAPFNEMNKAKKADPTRAADIEAKLQPLREFITNHIKGPNLGVMLDSETYANKDAAQSPSPVYKWALELLEGGEYSLEQVARAIERTVMDIARVFGTEHLLLGSTSAGTGSFALSKDKSNNFGLIIDSTLKALREAFEQDLLGPLWLLNGWDPELKPKLVTDTNATRDLESLSAVVRDLASAGVVLDREDEAVAEIFNLLGLPRLKGQILADPDAQLTGAEDQRASDDGMPEKPDPEADGEEDVPERGSEEA